MAFLSEQDWIEFQSSIHVDQDGNVDITSLTSLYDRKPNNLYANGLKFTQF